jgi:hypothetical protein
MKRLPTTTDKLQSLAERLEHQAALLRKQRDQVARQQQRLEKKVHDEALRQAGAVVEKMGIPLDDLGYLETILKCGLERALQGEEFEGSVVHSAPNQLTENFPMSSTAIHADANSESRSE